MFNKYKLAKLNVYCTLYLMHKKQQSDMIFMKSLLHHFYAVQHYQLGFFSQKKLNFFKLYPKNAAASLLKF